jgi:hypothetical protein
MTDAKAFSEKYEYTYYVMYLLEMIMSWNKTFLVAVLLSTFLGDSFIKEIVAPDFCGAFLVCSKRNSAFSCFQFFIQFHIVMINFLLGLMRKRSGLIIFGVDL